MEQVAAAGDPSDCRKIRKARIHFGEVQYPSLDARLFRRTQYLALRRFRRLWGIQAAGSSSRKIHADGVARELWHADARSYNRRQRNENGQFRFHREALLNALYGALLARLRIEPAAVLFPILRGVDAWASF